jgi:hypothetical protein
VATASIVELELVPVATTVPSIAVLYRAEHVAMVRRLALIGAPVDLAEDIAHGSFLRVGRHWDGLEDPLTTVRRLAIDDVLSRFRPPGKAPTRTPPRVGAAPAWADVGAFLDPLAPAERVVAVLRTYDGLDHEAIARLMPVRRERGAPAVDHRLATCFADAVSDISPRSRLTELLGADAGGGSLADDAAPLPGARRVRPVKQRRVRHPHGRSRYWVGAGAAAAVLIGLVGGHFDTSLPTRASRPQELRTGLTVDGTVVPGGAAQSSCPSADPVDGPAATAPDRVAAMLATDRRAIIALHRGATDARLTDAGGDGPIEVVIRAKRDCPGAPQAWKDIPLVFTTVADASNQTGTALTGGFPDGARWEVSDRPGLGLCGRLGDAIAPCGARLGQAEQLATVRLLADDAGHRVAFGYLPPQATTARLEDASGVLGRPTLLPDGSTFFALGSDVVDRPRLIRFYNGSGAALLAMPYPGR